MRLFYNQGSKETTALPSGTMVSEELAVKVRDTIDMPAYLMSGFTNMIITNQQFIAAMSPFCVLNQIKLRLKLSAYSPSDFPHLDNEDSLASAMLDRCNSVYISQAGLSKMTSDRRMNVRLAIVNIGKFDSKTQDAIVKKVKECAKDDYHCTNVDLLCAATKVNSQRKNAILFSENNPDTMVFVTNKFDEHTLIKLLSILPLTLMKAVPGWDEGLEIPNEMFIRMGELDLLGFEELFLTWQAKANERIEAANFNKGIKELSQVRSAAVGRVLDRLQKEEDKARQYEESLRRQQKLIESIRQEWVLECTVPENSFEEYAEYLSTIRRKSVMSVKASGNVLKMILLSPARVYDPDLLDVMIKSSVENKVNTMKPAMIQLFTDVFINQTYELNMYAAISINFDSFNISKYSGDDLPLQLEAASRFVYNPHIDIAVCFGNNLPLIIDAMSRRDLCMMHEQLLTAVSSINFSDGLILNNFIKQLQEYDHINTKTVAREGLTELATGRKLSICQYIKEYEEKEREAKRSHA